MVLKKSEYDWLVEALLEAYPSPSSLNMFVRYELDVDLEDITDYSQSRPEIVWNLVRWTEQTGRTDELIRAARAANPDVASLFEFEQEYRMLQDEDPSRTPGPPELPVSQKSALVEILLGVPKVELFEMRTRLLSGIPWQAKLQRNSAAATDLRLIVDQLSLQDKLSSGVWPLLILVDNARSFAKGTPSGKELDEMYYQLENFTDGLS